MSTQALTTHNAMDAVEQALVNGNIGALSQPERLNYYDRLCKSLGLNPLTSPFEYLTLNGKVKLYAKKDCTDQLRKINVVSVTKLEKERIEDVYAVTAYVQDGTGRVDSAVGAVPIANLKGEALANALMKAETKAKRRATLSICGLGFLDETEIETIPQAAIQIQNTPLLEAEKKLICDDCTGEIDAYAYVDPKGDEKFITLEKVREANKRDYPNANLCGKCQIARHALRRKMNSDEPQEAPVIEAAPVEAAKPWDIDKIEKEIDAAWDDEKGRAVGIVKKVYFKSGKKPWAVELTVSPTNTLHFSTFHDTEGKKLEGSVGKRMVLAYVLDGKYRNLTFIEKVGDQDYSEPEGQPF